jgi:hypothetical protein
VEAFIIKVGVLGALFLLSSFLCNGMDYAHELTNVLDNYFPIRNTGEYFSLAEIDKLNNESDPQKYRTLLYDLLADKYIPPQDMNFPVYSGGFHIFYCIWKKFDNRNINDLIFQLKLLTRLNSKYDYEYIYELASHGELLYNTIKTCIMISTKKLLMILLTHFHLLNSWY